jgi:hypothetical protein
MDKKKNENLKKKIKETHKKFCSAYNSLDELNNMFVYKNFEYRPVIDLNDDMDFILFYHGLYLMISEALQIMEQDGFIEPANFETY